MITDMAGESKIIIRESIRERYWKDMNICAANTKN